MTTFELLKAEAEKRGLLSGPVRYCPHVPTLKQAAYLGYDGLEAFYGGAVGGGKSDAILMDAEQFAREPNFASLLLRRTYRELALPGGLIPRSQAWFAGKGVRWDGTNFCWTFPSGAKIQFGYLENPYDHLRYQSSAFQLIGWEELPQWASPDQYLYMFSRLRRLVDSKVPIKMRANGNPDGPGLDWVKQRFVPDEYIKATDDVRFSRVWDTEKGRRFFPARLRDNPHIDAEEYERSLANLDPITRARLESGDWTASHIGRYFQKDWFKFVNEAPPLTRWVRGWDTGASENGDHSVGVKIGVYGRDVFIADIRRGKWDTPTVTRKVLETAIGDGPEVAVAIEQAHFALAVIQDLSRNKDFAQFPLIKIPIAGRDKEQRSRGWRARLGNGEVYLVRGGWNDNFIEECLRFTNEKDNTDDQIDATSVAFEAVFKNMGSIREPEKIIPIGTFKQYEQYFRESGNNGFGTS